MFEKGYPGSHSQQHFDNSISAGFVDLFGLPSVHGPSWSKVSEQSQSFFTMFQSTIAGEVDYVHKNRQRKNLVNGYHASLGCWQAVEIILLLHMWNLDKNHPDLRLQWSAWMVISREILDSVGYFDEKLAGAFEDFDYQLRAKYDGYELDSAPFLIIHLDEHTRFEDKNYPDMWEKARRYFGLKHAIAMSKWLKV